MDTYTKAAIKRIAARRQALRAEYASVMAEPASYGITGSVNASNRTLKEISAAITECDRQLDVLLRGQASMRISLPDYRKGGIR